MARGHGVIALVLAAASLAAVSAGAVSPAGSPPSDALPRAEVRPQGEDRPPAEGDRRVAVAIESGDGSAGATLPAGWHVGRDQVEQVALFTFTTYRRPREPRDPGFCGGEPIPAGQVLIRVSELPPSSMTRRSYPARPDSFRFPRKVRRGCKMIYDFTFRDRGRLINLWVWANLGRLGGRGDRAAERQRPRQVAVRPGLRRQIESLFDSLMFRSQARYPAMTPSLSRMCRSIAAGPCERRVEVYLRTRLPMTAISLRVKGRTVRLDRATPGGSIASGRARSRYWIGHLLLGQAGPPARPERLDLQLAARRPDGSRIEQRLRSQHIAHCRPTVCR